MRIFETHDKRAYIGLLLMGDEQESMIEKYLDACELYVLDDGGTKAVCAVCRSGNIVEVKNLAVVPEYRRMGYGRAFLEFVEEKYRGECEAIVLTTGDSALTVPFYEKCGYTITDRVRGYFTENYDRPIYECGKLLTDMVVMKKTLSYPK